MKNLFLLGLLIAVSQNLFAQEQKPNYDHVRRMEFELGIGMSKAPTVDGYKAGMGILFNLEIRMNFPDTPFDIGLQNTLGSFVRHLEENVSVVHYTAVIGGDYNFRKWRRIAPFAGLGLGIAVVSNNQDSGFMQSDWERARAFVFNPRIGVEFFSHLRITLEYKWMRKPYSYFGLNIGGVFGGGLKK